MRKSRLAWFCFGCLLLLLAATPVRAVLPTHLDVIELDKVLADPRFSGLTGQGQTIAVFDTGLDTSHLMINASRVPLGVNFAGDSPPLAPPSFADGTGHGTFVTSVAAGLPVTTTLGSSLVLDNRLFTAGSLLEARGVAPLATLMPVRVLNNSGNGNLNDVIAGLQLVAAYRDVLNITAVNMSFGSNSVFNDPAVLIANSQLIADLNAVVDDLTSNGVTVVAASGNSGATNGLSMPAILPNIISVGASEYANSVSNTEVAAGFSNVSDQLDIFAPGVDVVGALGRVQPGDSGNGLAVGPGTSFAAPQVAGAVMLINELFQVRHNRAPTPSEIRYLLGRTDTTIDINGTPVPRLDLYAALEAAYAIPAPTALLPGFVLITIVWLRRRRPAPVRAA